MQPEDSDVGVDAVGACVNVGCGRAHGVAGAWDRIRACRLWWS